MKILLAGQNGIIGSYLWNGLKNNNEIIGIGKGHFDVPNYFDIDLSDMHKIEKFVNSQSKFDVLIFLVGLAHSKGKNQDYPKFEEVNFSTLFYLLETQKKFNRLPDKIIFSSTISVYGEKMEKDIYKEEDKLSPSSPYAKTKILAEQYLDQNFKDKTWILRFSPVYSADFLLNIQRRSIIKGKFYKVGNGENKLSLLNIKNISFTIKEILNNNVEPGIYNLADESRYSFNDLLKFNKAEKIIRIPKIFMRVIYYLGIISKNIFLKENSIKLISNNIYSTEKISQQIKLPFSLFSE